MFSSHLFCEETCVKSKYFIYVLISPVLSKLVEYLDSVVGGVSDHHGVVGSHCNTWHNNTIILTPSSFWVVFTSRPCEKSGLAPPSAEFQYQGLL